MARLNYFLVPERPTTFPVQRKGWRSAKRNAKAPNGVDVSVAQAYRKRVREDIRAHTRAASQESFDMDVDPDEDEIRAIATLHQTFDIHPSFNGVNHFNIPPAPYAYPTVPEVHNNISGYGYPPMAHQDNGISPYAVPVILGYIPEFKEEMDIDAEGFGFAPQVPINPYAPHFGFGAIPGNPAVFNNPGIDVTPYNPNEPYFNGRPQVVPHHGFGVNGMVPYNPNEPYFHAGPQIGVAGMHNPAVNVPPPYHAPQIIPENHFFINNANVPQPPMNNGIVEVAQGEGFVAPDYLARPPEPGEPFDPAMIREAEDRGDRNELYAELFGDDEDDEEDEEEEDGNAPGPGGGGPPWEPNEDDEEDEDEDELEIII